MKTIKKKNRNHTWYIGTWVMGRAHTQILFSWDEWGLILYVTNFVCHVNWWQIFFLHYRLMFCFPFSPSNIISSVKSEVPCLHMNEYNIQYTYICRYIFLCVESVYNFVFLFFSSFIFIVSYVASFLLAVEPMAWNTFTFTFDFVAHILSMPGHGKYSSSTWYCIQLEVANYERVTNETCAYFYLLHYSWHYHELWMRYIFFFFSLLRFFLFTCEKRVRVCASLFNIGTFEVCHVYSMILMKFFLSAFDRKQYK